MKAQKVLSLDIEIIEELSKINNQSKLVNTLLKDHFFSGGSQELEEIKANILLEQKNILDNKAKVELLKNRLKQLEEKDIKFKEIFGSVPQVILDDFKEFPKMSEDTLLSRYNEFYFGKIEWDNLLRAFNEYYKDVTR